MDNNQIIDLIRGIDTAEKMGEVAAKIRAIPGDMNPAVQKALLDKLAEVTAQSKAAREGAIATLELHGVSYPLTDWLTPKNYAKKFGIKNTETVINWINRGVISSENVKIIEDLDLRLVRAIEYAPRKHSSHKLIEA